MTRTTLGPRDTCPPEHKHAATSTCYCAHRCGCDDCRAAHAAGFRTRTRAQLYGRWDSGLVPAEPVREHLAHLAENGMGARRVADLLGVHRSVIRRIVAGRSSNQRYGEIPANIARDKATRILAVRVDYSTIADGATVSGRGVHRRLQALVALGWSQNALAHRLGQAPTNMTRLMAAERVTARMHRTIAALYDELSGTTPAPDTDALRRGAARARRQALAKGWVPPLAWDDIDQDPTPAPITDEDVIDELAIEHFLAGHPADLTRLERLEVVGRLTDAGKSSNEIAARLGVSQRQVTRDRLDHRTATDLEQETA